MRQLFFSNMQFLLRCTRAHMPTLLFWVGVSVAVNVSLGAMELYLPKLVIDAVTGGDMRRVIVTALLATVALALLLAFAKFCERYVYHSKHQMGLHYMRKVALKGLVSDYAHQENAAFRTLQQESYNMCASNETMLRNIYKVWIDLLSGTLGFLFFGAVLAQLSPVVLVFLVASTVLSYRIGLSVTRWSAQNNAERTGYHHKLGYIDRMAEDVKAAKDIRLYRMEAWFQSVYQDNIDKIARWYARYDRLVIKVSFANASISLLREGIAYAYLIHLAVAGRIDAGGFVLYFAAITGFSGWLGHVFTQMTELARISGHVTRFRDYLDFPDVFKREGGVGTADMISCPRVMEMKNVSYRYEDAQSDTLRGITLTLRAGEHLGIVGLNGAGKTTLVKLLCGLLDPTDGCVLYDGVNVCDYDRDKYYRLFSAVFQSFSLLPLSLEEVVAETIPENIDRDKVRACLKSAGLWDKVASLPQGTFSLLDRSINDDAVAFSGGELQKLLLARALYKDAPVLLLDEPTAALDPIAENQLYESYHAITQGKTSVFISHRLASTRFCDRILLIDDGRIVESGTHNELMLLRGRYHALYETQAQYYREDAQEEVAADA